MFVAWLLLAAGCAAKGDHPPTARINVTPSHVPVDDNYTTEVLLDGSGSRDDVDDPLAVRPLLYEWRVEDPKAFISPDAFSPQVAVKIAGTRPVTVRLTIADGSNTKTTVTAQIGVTLP
jgi:hypothetical protein